MLATLPIVSHMDLPAQQRMIRVARERMILAAECWIQKWELRYDNGQPERRRLRESRQQTM